MDFLYQSSLCNYIYYICLILLQLRLFIKNKLYGSNYLSRL